MERMSKWISVKDKLPEKRGYYWTIFPKDAYEERRVEIGFYSALSNQIVGQGTTIDKDGFTVSRLLIGTHWMEITNKPEILIEENICHKK